MANGFEAYRGPSEINGQPIKLIVTGTAKASQNPKTADMMQAWAFPIASKPSEAVKNGDDVAVCGSCPHRPSVAKAKGVKACYVRTWQQTATWNAQYPSEPASRNVPIRLGAWGEPTAVPFNTIKGLVNGNGHTGYTHRWQECDPRFKALLMASVDNEGEAVEAKAKGWRYFRVMNKGESVNPGEVLCPASAEAGHPTTCDLCLLCSGLTSKAKNVATYAQ